MAEKCIKTHRTHNNSDIICAEKLPCNDVGFQFTEHRLPCIKYKVPLQSMLNSKRCN